MNKRYSEAEKMFNISNYFGLAFIISAILTLILILSLGKESDIPFFTSLISIVSFIIFIPTKLKAIKKIKEELIEESKENFENLGFDTNEFTFSTSTNDALKLDEDNSRMIYVYRENNISDYAYRYIPFDKILDVSINSNGTSLISTSKSGAIGGALAGGLIAGGVGSIVGSSVANKTSTEKVHSMSMLITIDDLNTPVINFEMLNLPNGMDKNSEEYKRFIKRADELFGKFTVILKRNEKLNNIG